MSTVTSIRTARNRGPVTCRKLLTPGEVATLFGVDPKTVVRWANQGRFATIRTLGSDRQLGHRRFFEDEVRAALNGGAS